MVSVELIVEPKGVEEFKRRLEVFDAEMRERVHGRLKGWAEDVRALARKLVPVRTGYLRSTIYARVNGWVVEVGAGASYALFVEFGTRYMRARPFLVPAVQRWMSRLERVILEALEDAKRGAGFG
ncbi:MAG: hypothetical protein DRO93_13060 [Candidatus Thorarchaeota archaeon]|nr:MAG: hypothetical protein DRO41_05955 [Candidatus Bathyarchaeota archaeon]RLI53995.1 MAG: hypothetical protein DRO93_13060 [Candidatus Thorarchaeota archaeon]